MSDPTPPDDPQTLIRETENHLLRETVRQATTPVLEEEKKRQLNRFNNLINQTLAGIDSDGEAEKLLQKVRSLPPDRDETPTKGGGRRRRRHRKTRRKKSKRKTKRKKTRRR